MHSMYDTCFERLAGWATGPRFEPEIEDARRTFFEGTGVVHEDDDSFEQRMSGLSEYYLFDRPLRCDREGRVPARLFLFEEDDSLDAEQRRAFRSFTHTIHGLFEVKKLRRELVVVRDLFTLENHRVLERRQVAGMRKGDILDARLVPWEEHLVFGRSFIFHPREARKPILQMTKRLRKEGEMTCPEARRSAIWRLARAALVHGRQQQNNRAPPRVDLIYGDL